MLVDKTINLYCKPANKNHLQKLGYKWKNNTCIQVKILDLPPKSKKRIKCICDYCGEQFEISYESYYIRHKKSNLDVCKECRKEYKTNTKINKFSRNPTRKNFNEIKEIYKKNNCILLSKKEEYQNIRSKLKFICKCGRIGNKTFAAFRLTPYCRKCCIENCKRGKEHYAWIDGRSKTRRDTIRRTDEYKQWRKKVFERDNYTCQCCGDNRGNNLRAHHIMNYSEHKDLRFDVDNGITLCDKCHDFHIYGSFHHIYGAKNNNKKQLEEYIKRYKNGEFDKFRKEVS